MIAFDELLRQIKGLDRRDLMRWVENRWVLPERREQTWIFHEVDIARVELILEIRQEFAIDEEALPLVLGLLDQVYDLRRQLRRICDALDLRPVSHQVCHFFGPPIRRQSRRAGTKPQHYQAQSHAPF